MMACASCGTELEPHAGPGRPSVYCSEPCRRMAEFRIRGLVKRIEKAELEIRELNARYGRFEYADADERRSRLREMRRWLAEDQARLRALLGAKNQMPGPVKSNSSKGETPHGNV